MENGLVVVCNFFIAPVVDNLFDNNFLYKNVEDCFLLLPWRMMGTDVMKMK